MRGKMQRILDMKLARREGSVPIALCLHFYLCGVCLALWLPAGRLFWRRAGSSLTVMTTYLCRQVWMFCQHSSIYDRSQMWVQEHTVLYPNPEINETWLPSRPQIPKCVCVCVTACVYAWVRRETGDSREGGVAAAAAVVVEGDCY